MSCCFNEKEPVFSGETKKLVGFWCPNCQVFEPPVGREKLITLDWYYKNKEKQLDYVTKGS